MILLGFEDSWPIFANGKHSLIGAGTFFGGVGVNRVDVVENGLQLGLAVFRSS